MAPGDILVEIVEDATAIKVKETIDRMRLSDDDKWLMTSLNNGQDVLIVCINNMEA